MSTDRLTRRAALERVRGPVEQELHDFLAEEAREIGRRDPLSVMLVDDIQRLVAAGGKRLRPAFCVWAYRAAGPPEPGGPDAEIEGPIVRAAAALELLHTMALIHDDLIDEAAERRGAPASEHHLAAEARRRRLPGDPARFGRVVALLAGDLAAVLADRMLLTSGFEPAALVRALALYHEMRLDMAAGQLVDVAGTAVTPGDAVRAARLKGGSYTVEGPLLVGVALAGDRPDVADALRSFGAPLGEAFQLRDDLRDREGADGVTFESVQERVAQARAALRGAPIDADAAGALYELARSVAEP